MIVYWTPEARDRLHDIQAYIASEAPNAAKKVVERLIRRSEQLAVAPESGRHVPEYPHTDIRELLEKPYRIIYRISTNQIEVLSVMHYRQCLPKQPKGLHASLSS